MQDVLVDPGDPGTAADGRDDGVASVDVHAFMEQSLERGAGNALVNERDSQPEFSTGVQGRDVFGPGLRELAAKHAWIGEVRGTGAFWALELVTDRETREPLAPYGGSSPAMAAILAASSRRGLLPLANFNRIHVVPPLTTTVAEAREGLDILDQALSEARDTVG
jgi:adenosylmethionine-8-amino-7-oxononanoate aminotransferase